MFVFCKLVKNEKIIAADKNSRTYRRLSLNWRKELAYQSKYRFEFKKVQKNNSYNEIL